MHFACQNKLSGWWFLVLTWAVPDAGTGAITRVMQHKAVTLIGIVSITQRF